MSRSQRRDITTRACECIIHSQALAYYIQSHHVTWQQPLLHQTLLREALRLHPRP